MITEPTIRDVFLDTARICADLIRRPEIAGRWNDPSALPEMSVAALAVHLSGQVTRAQRLLGTPPGTAAIPVLDHYRRNAWVTSGRDGADNVRIRRQSAQAAAATTPARVASDIDAAIGALRATLPAEPVGRVLDLGEWGLTVEDFLLTRVMEMVVHADDLAVSAGVATPDLPGPATAATIDLLARVAAWRHGPMALVRALSRRERAPGTVAAF